jgi:hypothetical protein
VVLANELVRRLQRHRRKWARNDQARAVAQEVADPKATTQKDCIPIGLPATMFYPVATNIDVQKDKVVIKIDWMDTTRTVYLDGRKHPPASQQSLNGHSVGHWEGKTLVVETTNFTDHKMGSRPVRPAARRRNSPSGSRSARTASHWSIRARWRIRFT